MSRSRGEFREFQEIGARSSPAAASRALAWALLVLAVGSATTSRAAEGLPSIRRIDVPAGRPAQWPKGDWQPVAVEDFQRLLERAQPARDSERRSWIDRAEYTATLAGNTLAEGGLTFQVRRTGARHALLPLDPLDLVVSQLAWEDEPAVWGTAADGRTLVVVDRAEGLLTGRWSRQGRVFPRTVEFDLQLAPATVSQLKLRLPKDRLLQSSAGDVSLGASDGGEWQEWHVSLGAETHCRLTVMPQQPPAPLEPLVLISEQDSSVAVRPGEVRFQSVFNLEVLQAPVQALTFAIPPGVQIESVQYGTETPLMWAPVEQEDDRRRIRIQLPDALLGRGRSIRIQGTAAWDAQQPLVLAAPQLLEGSFLTGRAEVTIEKPLAVRRFDTAGLRQISGVSRATEEVYRFQQFRPDATLTADIRSPEPSLSAHVLTHLSLGESQWTSRSEIEWHSAAGASYEVSCRLPPEWEVTDVLLPSPSLPGDLVGWEVEQQEDGSILLRVEFLEALAPGKPRQTRVTARRRAALSGQPLGMPHIQPLNCRSVDMLVAVDPPASARLTVDKSARFEEISLSDVDESWKQRNAWAMVAGATEGRIWLRQAVAAPAGGSLHIISGLPQAEVQTRVETGSGGQNIIEHPERSDRSPHDRVDIVASSPAEDKLHPTATLELESLLASEGQTEDLHRARLVVNRKKTGALALRLDPTASLISVTVDGAKVSPRRDGERLLLPDLSNDASHEIELLYRAAVSRHFLGNTRDLVLPRIDLPVVSFRWVLAHSPEMRLLGEPDGVRLLQPAGHASWRQRLFGPLSRAGRERFFNPLSSAAWRQLWGSGEPTQRRRIDPPSSSFIRPADWKMSTTAMPYMPERISVAIGSVSQIVLLSYAAMLACLVIGITLRMLRVRWRHRLGGVWLAVTLTAAALVPDIYSMILGGCVIGTVLALLFPRRSLPPLRRPGEGSPVPAGSTQSYRHVAFPLLLLLAGVLSAHAVAQEATTSPGAAVVRTGGESFDLLVPVDEAGNPSSRLPLVYAARGLVDRLNELAASRPADPEYLLQSAEYTGRADGNGTVALTARFRVALLASEPVVDVQLPFSGANLGGANACLVNGIPHPVSRSPDGTALVVSLAHAPVPPAPAATPESDAEQESGQETEGDSQEPGDSPLAVEDRAEKPPAAFTTAEIELNLHQPKDVFHEGEGLRLSIPAVIASRLTIDVPDQFPAVEVPSARGSVTAGTAPIDWGAELGRTGLLEVRWLRQKQAAVDPASVEISGAYLVDVRPTWLQCQAQVAYRVLGGSLDYVVWTLPQGSIVRTVTADELLRFTPIAGQRQLLIEFSTPRTSEFTVRAEILIPSASATETVQIPPLGGFEPSRPEDLMKLGPFQLGVVTAPELRLEPAPGVADAFTPLSPDVFQRTWGASAGGTKPALAWQYQSPAPLELSVLPLRPSRVVRQHQTVDVERHVVQWTLSAEVETKQAPAFQHRLRVDPELRIDTISVLEDGAERLVRWSRVPVSEVEDELVLFLSDRTTGTQSVSLAGTLPSEPLVRVPRVSFQQAEQADSRLTISHIPELAIALEGTSLMPVGEAAEQLKDGHIVPAGRYKLPEGAEPVRFRVHPRSRGSAVSAVALMRQHEEEQWELAWFIRFAPAEMEPRRFECLVPPELAGEARIEIEGARLEQELLSDGSLRLDIEQSPEAGRAALLRLTTPVTAVLTNDWNVPRVEVTGESSTPLLIVSPADQLVPMPNVPPLASSSVPEWFEEAAGVGELESAVYSLQEGLRLTFVPRVPLQQELRVLLAETRIDVVPEQGDRGWTSLIVAGASAAANEITVALPAELQVLAAHVNQRAAPVFDGEPGRVRIPLDQQAEPQQLTLVWERKATGSLPWLGSIGRSFPAPENVPIAISLVTVVPPQGERLSIRDGLERTVDTEEALQLLDLLAASESQRSDGTAPNLLHAAYLAMRPVLDEEVTAEQQTRLDLLKKQIEANGTGEEVTLAGVGDLDLRVAADEHPAFLHGRVSAEPHKAEFWVIRQVLLSAGAAIVGFLLLLPLLLRIVQSGAGDWLSRHATVAWLLLGIVWWLFLTPSVVGFLLVLFALVRPLRRNAHESPTEIREAAGRSGSARAGHATQ